MAITTETEKIRVTAKFNNGLDQSGNIQTLSVGLPTLSVDNYSDAGAIAVIIALKNCYNKTLYKIEKTIVQELDQTE